MAAAIALYDWKGRDVAHRADAELTRILRQEVQHLVPGAHDQGVAESILNRDK
ncbi:hypothetical protein [Streptomyces collinus]|uniref:hypothetical protein n=1 Tax=Streptomyces collinus TaxID=42684 RepID=UPI001F38EE7C|nr:hypothetical protein [Streptomyces collinus]